ncbi:MAG TPA: bifunctional folylpolyglutamate synthase/dihydrofolate synthase, partial [Rhodospirillaceae bacterium]|nr:bifunctional folylpolyglutamate synthase/dihydrofolate synthase [Rhodospirillaceae bacterium]
VIFGMLSTKKPEEFLDPIKHFINSVSTVHITDEMACFSAEELAKATTAIGIKNCHPQISFDQAFNNLIDPSQDPSRILACGSLYLAGLILRENKSF